MLLLHTKGGVKGQDDSEAADRGQTVASASLARTDEGTCIPALQQSPVIGTMLDAGAVK